MKSLPLLDNLSEFSHSDFVIRICLNVKSQWTKKVEVFSQGADDSKNLRFETPYIGDYEYVNISSFAVLGYEEDDDLNRNDPLRIIIQIHSVGSSKLIQDVIIF